MQRTFSTSGVNCMHAQPRHTHMQLLSQHGPDNCTAIMFVCPAQVLKNSSVPFQEGKSVELSMLTSRGVKPYGPPVDVWAAGVLAYELVCGRWVIQRAQQCCQPSRVPAEACVRDQAQPHPLLIAPLPASCLPSLYFFSSC